MIEYVLLFGVVLIMFLLSFMLGYAEYRKPRDPGPLNVDLSRTAGLRYEASQFRTGVESSLEHETWKPALPSETPEWVGKALVCNTQLRDQQGAFSVFRTDQDVVVPAGATFESALIVRGSFTSGEDCKFNRWLYIEGRCQIGSRNRLAAVFSLDDLVIGEESEILSFADSDNAVRIRDGCILRGPVGAGRHITVEGSCDMATLNGPIVKVLKT